MRRLGTPLRALGVTALASAALAGWPQGAPAQAPPDVPMEHFGGLPPAGKVEVSRAAMRLRDRLLGPRHDDPRFVTLHWTGVSSFVVTMGGHLFLFDAWEILGLHADYLPLGREELAGLEPEAILLGHGHFDHAGDAGYVAGRTGAAIVASDTQCAAAKADAAAEGNAGRFRCVLTGSQNFPAFGDRTRARLFRDLPKMTVMKNVHSVPGPPSEQNPLDPFLPVFDPAPYVEHLNTDPAELIRFLGYVGDPEGGSRLFHLRAGRFALLLGDSAGPIHDHRPIRRSLNRLPGCVDVMANAILGFDQPVVGMAPPVRYIRRVRPKVFLPTHGDAWAPVLSAGQAAYRAELLSRLTGLPHPPRVDYLLDPEDYLRQRSYRTAAERWRDPVPGTSCAARGGPNG